MSYPTAASTYVTTSLHYWSNIAPDSPHRSPDALQHSDNPFGHFLNLAPLSMHLPHMHLAAGLPRMVDAASNATSHSCDLLHRTIQLGA
jgi:hypothetical protein